VCLDRHEPEVITPEDEPLLGKILRRVANETPRNDWFETPPAPRDRIDALVNWLVAEGYLQMDAPLDGQFVLTDKGEEMLD